MYETFGIILFYLLVVILIPYILYKKKLFWLIEVYLPNVDLIANLLTYIGGPMGIWDNLYLQGDNIGVEGGISQLLMNYTALLGLTYIVARESVKEKSIIEGWSFSIIMLFVTYLVPGDIVNGIMRKVKKSLLKKGLTLRPSLYLSFIAGLVGSIAFILLEAFFIKYYRIYIVKFVGSIIKKVKT